MTYPNNSNVYLPGTIQVPSTLQITAITRAYPAVMTVSVNSTTAENTYIAGQLLKLTIPFNYGMQQANGQTVQILDVSGNDITIDLNTTQFDAFSVPGSGEMPASAAPAGSRNLQFSNSTYYVPFQSFNNTGN